MKYTFEQLTAGEQKIIKMAEKSYISVMGEEKWKSLSEQQKHDAVMLIVEGIYRSIHNTNPTDER